MRRPPAVHGARDSERGERAALGNRVFAATLPVVLHRRAAARRTAGIQRLDAAGIRTRDEPEAIAAKPRHMRVDHAQHRVRRDGRVDRAAAALQGIVAGSAREHMGGRHHAVLRVSGRAAGSRSVWMAHYFCLRFMRPARRRPGRRGSGAASAGLPQGSAPQAG